jgi:hypothetical protein
MSTENGIPMYAVRAEKKFRLVYLNETIEGTDQVLLDDCISWTSVDTWAVGTKFNPIFNTPIRRAL